MLDNGDDDDGRKKMILVVNVAREYMNHIQDTCMSASFGSDQYPHYLFPMNLLFRDKAFTQSLEP